VRGYYPGHAGGDSTSASLLPFDAGWCGEKKSSFNSGGAAVTD